MNATLDALSKAWAAKKDLGTLNAIRDALMMGEGVPADKHPRFWLAEQLAIHAPLKIELKKFSASERFSEETLLFKADIYLDGKKVGWVENEGRGGPCNEHFTEPHLYTFLATWAKLQAPTPFSVEDSSSDVKFDPITLDRLTNCCGTRSEPVDYKGEGEGELMCKGCGNAVAGGEGDGSEQVTLLDMNLDYFFSRLADQMQREKEKKRIDRWVAKQAQALRARGRVPRRFEIRQGAKISTVVIGYSTTNANLVVECERLAKEYKGGMVSGGEVVS